jgi:hypothetical protein
MASAIDATKPADNVQVAKSELRANFLTAKNEITALQAATSFARSLAFNGLGRPKN